MKENKKHSGFWKCVAFMLFGVIIGFMIAPAKEGISCGNNNENNYSGAVLCSDDCEEEEE